MNVTKPVTVSTTSPRTTRARISVSEPNRKGNVFLLVNDQKVAVLRADGYFNRLKGADSAVTGFRHLPDGRIASPVA
jgi:hypothetical protein